MRELMIGNYAIARGFVEAGVELASAYPGTPSSEILPGIVEFARRENAKIDCEWSVNERIAFEVALGAALSGRKAVCMMKQVGLNVAFPSFFEAISKEIKGGLVVVSCDDPGPQSSQTEQDTRMVSSLINVPVFDPSSPSEAADVAYYALLLSQKTKRPIVIRPTHRVSHSREAIRMYRPGKRKVRLKEGILNGAKTNRLGIVASGMSYSIAMDVIQELGIKKLIPVYKVLMIHPLDQKVIEFRDRVERVLVLEETDATLEAKLIKEGKVYGRLNGTLPQAGELSYDIIREAIIRMCDLAGMEVDFKKSSELKDLMREIEIPPKPPRLCSGCPHRASFYAMKKAFPDALFPGDIGCYTLGIPLGAVDVFVDMGGSVNLAAGFYDVLNKDGKDTPIVASCGDSTFFHACLPAIYDAQKKKKRFILIIMDNGTTAMTGMQPTPQVGITALGEKTRAISIEATLLSLGIKNVKVVDPYQVPLLIETIRDCYERLRKGEGPCVIISRRECLLLTKRKWERKIDLEEYCTGCKRCLREFDCPSLEFDEVNKKIRINKDLCTGCGVCLFVCPQTKKRGEFLEF